MNIFKYEMKQHRKSILSWAVTYTAAIFVIMSATPLFIEDSSAMRDTLAMFSDSIRDAMGIDLELFFSPVGFYSYIFLYMGLVASIHAMGTGLNIISKETRMKTVDFLISKPVSRVSVYWQKWLAAFCALMIPEAAFFLSATASMFIHSGGEFAVTAFVLISATIFFIQMMFLSIGLCIAAVLNKIKSTLSVTMGCCFGVFLIGMIASIAGGGSSMGVLRYLSLLRYFDNNYIMLHSAYETVYLVICAVLTVGMTAAGFAVYVKKDVHSAV